MAEQEHDVAAFEAITPGDMQTIEIEGQTILLVRDNEIVHALGATCPHAGGPLAQGVRCGDRLVCPWHKATFSMRTGAVLEPPAVDPLLHHKARIANGRVLVTLTAEEQLRDRPSNDARCFVVIGAGAAGAVAA
ncbi:MAG TPA: Rieske 2Fe-2S domain-containing protein [Acetobacteraceae bacterium]|nr:Rieske 2Fe-2S domain-containing protein [Acetobacteraceae bacterium]